VLDELVGDGDALYPRGDAVGRQPADHALAEATGAHVLLGGDDA
jgi:hypothetical protein